MHTYTQQHTCTNTHSRMHELHTHIYTHLPGHATILQPSEPEGLPTQSAPDPCGIGLEQVRVRVRVPPPQVSEQPDHDVHCDQPPLTTCDDHVIINTVHKTTPTIGCSPDVSVTVSSSKAFIT